MASDPDAAVKLLNELLDVSTERRLMLAYEAMLRQRQVELFMELRSKPTEVPYSQICQAAGTDTKTVERAMAAALKQSSLTDAVTAFVRMTRMDANSIRVAVHKARAGRPPEERLRPTPVEWSRVRSHPSR